MSTPADAFSSSRAAQKTREHTWFSATGTVGVMARLSESVFAAEAAQASSSSSTPSQKEEAAQEHEKAQKAPPLRSSSSRLHSRLRSVGGSCCSGVDLRGCTVYTWGQPGFIFRR